MTIIHRKGDDGLKRAKYKCDICGKIDFWSDGWSTYGSINHEEYTPDDMPTSCSDKCLKVMAEKIKSGEFKLPELSRSGYNVRVKRDRQGY